MPNTNVAITPPYAAAGPPETEVPLLQQILSALGGSSSSGSGPATVNVNGFIIPAYDKINFTYYGSTNNIYTQVFSMSGTTVATLTYAYAGGAAADNDVITVIAKS